MARILLLNPTYRGRASQKSMPHGLLAVGATLKKNGHSVQLIDFHLEGDSPDRANTKLTNLDFELIGISGISTAYYFWKEFIQLYRSTPGGSVPIIAGGSVASTMPETFLENIPVDAICTGDAEPVVNELVDALLHGYPLDDIDGIALRKDKQIIVKPGIRVRDMDTEVPRPDYSLIDLDQYRWQSWDQKNAILEIVLFSSRGCPYDCFFCSRNFGRQFTQHSVDFVIEHIDHIVSLYKPDRLCFSDELFTLDRSWILDFLDRYIQSRFNIPFRINSRVNTVDREILQKLKEANCSDIGFGIESGSDRILHEMNKRVTARQNMQALKTSRDVGLNATATIVLGMPAESDTTITETRDFLIEADIKKFGGFFATAYPGSALFDYACEHGYITDVDAYMQKLDNADRLVINYTQFSDTDLKLKMETLKKDVEYAWHRKRGFWSVLRLKGRPVATAFKILFSRGPIEFFKEVWIYVARLRSNRSTVRSDV